MSLQITQRIYRANHDKTLGLMVATHGAIPAAGGPKHNCIWQLVCGGISDDTAYVIETEVYESTPFKTKAAQTILDKNLQECRDEIIKLRQHFITTLELVLITKPNKQ